MPLQRRKAWIFSYKTLSSKGQSQCYECSPHNRSATYHWVSNWILTGTNWPTGNYWLHWSRRSFKSQQL